jgi:hypothetical protein
MKTMINSPNVTCCSVPVSGGLNENYQDNEELGFLQRSYFIKVGERILCSKGAATYSALDGWFEVKEKKW